MVDKNKSTGYIVFALGIVLLVVTFYLAIHTYLNPEFIKGFSDLVEIGGEGLAQIVDFLIYIIPVLFLFAMGSVAGKITKYGTKMIKSPEKKTVEKVQPRPSTQQSQQPKTEQPKQKQSQPEKQKPKGE